MTFATNEHKQILSFSDDQCVTQITDMIICMEFQTRENWPISDLRHVGPSVCIACVALMVFTVYFRNSSEGSCYIKISSAWHHRPTVQSCFWSLNTAFGSSAASAALNCQREIKGQNTSVQTPVRQIKHSWFPLEKSWSVHVQAYKTSAPKARNPEPSVGNKSRRGQVIPCDMWLHFVINFCMFCRVFVCNFVK